MKIGLVTPEFPPMVGGTSHHAFGLACALARTDEITVYTSAALTGKSDSLCGFKIQPLLTREINADTARLAAQEVDAWLLLNAGYAPLSLKFDAPTFVYCHGNDFLIPWINCEGAFFTHVAGVVPYILTRFPFVWRYKPVIQSWIHRRNMAKLIAQGLIGARHVFVNSHYTLQQLRRAIPSFTQSVTVSFPGVHPDLLADDATLARRSTRRTDDLRLLTITRLESCSRHKSVDELLYAVAELNNVALSLTIIGDGDDRIRLESLSRTLKVDDRVKFMGTVNSDSLAPYLDDADLLVLVSDDSFGMVYVEAATRGVPSLARTKTREVDAVIPGTTGLLIDSAAPAEIAAGIRRFKNERDGFDPFRIRQFAEQFVWPNIGASLRAELVKRL